MHYEINPNELEVYHEGTKRRLYIGKLSYNPKSDRYHFIYAEEYLYNKSAFGIGPELPLNKVEHISPPGKLFPTFVDRIPSKENPAYPEYCISQGISPQETNQIILLGTIGRRGPSSFVFEAVYQAIGSVQDELISFRKELQLSRWDFAQAFNIPELTISKIEAGKSNNANIIQLIHIYINYPEVALQQLRINGRKIHAKSLTTLYRYFNKLKENKSV